MATIDLSPVKDVRAFKQRLWDQHRIEIPCFEWRDRALMRLSIQAYNTIDDVRALIAGLEDCIANDKERVAEKKRLV